MRWNVQKIMYPETLNLNSPVFQWSILRLMLILQCILGFQSQIIDFKNSFAHANIPNGEPFFIELPRDLKSDKRNMMFFSG